MTTFQTDRAIEPAWLEHLMADLGSEPVAFVQILDKVRDEQPGLDRDTVEDELLARPEVLMRDADVINLLAASEGVVLTHVVTEQEKELEVLVAHGDLDLWARLADEGLPLASGGTVQARWALGGKAFPDDATSGLTGPAGWLEAVAAGDLVGLRLSGGRLHVEKVQLAPELDKQTADRVRAFSEYTLKAARQALEEFTVDEPEGDPGAPLDDVVAYLVVDRPDVLRQPLPPLSKLLDDQGMERLGGLVGLPGVPLGDEVDDFSPRELWALVTGQAALLSLRQYPDDSEVAAAVLLAMAVPAVAERIADTVEERPLADQVIDTLLAAVGTDDERGLALLVASRSAEGRADYLAAERHVAEAARLIPDCWPVVHEAAMFAAARGEAVEADRLLRGAGAGKDEPLRHSMRELTDLPEGVVSRNRPCPCGSGRKYKACCLPLQRHPLVARAELVFARLLVHSRRPHLLPALARYVGLVEERALPLAIDLALFDGGVIEDYLRRRGHLIAEDEQALLRTWLATPLQPYEVQHVQQYRSVTLRPLLGGEPVVLRDRSFSSCGVASLDVLLARPLSNGERPVLLSLPVLVHRMRRAALLELFRDGTYDADDLAAFFGPQPSPKLRNRDGEDLIIGEAQYQVTADDAWQRLSATLDPDSDDDNCLVLAGREVADDEYLLRGTVRRAGDLWTVTANSVERMDELEMLVLAAAPDAELVTESSTPGHELMGAEPEAEAKSPFRVDGEHELSPAEQAALLDEHMRAYERRWVEDAVPALDGISPREAFAAGGATRARLEAMLDDFEWAHRQNGGGMDAGRIRALLGM